MSFHLIILDVSGQRFRVQKATLHTSPFFNNLLSRWNDGEDRQEDGSFFINADADTFQHVLDFMHRPSKFSLFWTKEAEFDYALYTRLEVEADYFLLHDLRDWIQNKRYLDAVKTVVNVEALSLEQLKCRKDVYETSRAGPDIEVESYFGHYEDIKRVGNACILHIKGSGMKRSCEDCKSILHRHGPEFYEPRKKITLVVKRVEFDGSVCVNEMGDN